MYYEIAYLKLQNNVNMLTFKTEKSGSTALSSPLSSYFHMSHGLKNYYVHWQKCFTFSEPNGT